MFLPGVQEAAGKAYTALDDIISAAERGHTLISLLTELVQAVGLIFHHSNVPVSSAMPHELDPPTTPSRNLQQSLNENWGPVVDSRTFVFDPLTQGFHEQADLGPHATTRDEKIARDSFPA
jgi:hypothetical protein